MIIPGALLNTNVRLVRPYREGGMGSVWVADHLTLETEVAVKFLLGEHAGDPAARERFAREAAIASKVRSAHVVTVHDYGVAFGDVPFIVMELLSGIDLGRRLEIERKLKPAVVVTIVAQLCHALERVHAAGIVHRDVKPENVFLTSEGDEVFVKLLDFGIARSSRLGELGPSSRATRPGESIGTPYYMSPEQFKGSRVIGGRSDQWAVGVMVYEALTGTLPFIADSVAALAIVVNDAIAPRPSFIDPSLPIELDAWFARACGRTPDARFESVRSLADALAKALSGPARSDEPTRISQPPSLRPRVETALDTSSLPPRTTPRPTPKMTAGESKGTIVLAAKNYTVAKHGAEAWSRVLSALEPADRMHIQGITAVGWVPSETYGRLLERIDRELGPPGKSLMPEYGRYGAEHDLTLFHRLFLRMASPPFVLEKTAEYWRRFHTSGRWTVARLDATQVSAALSDFYIGTHYCAALTSYISRLFELVGAKEVASVHRDCVSRGASACVFKVRYLE